MKVWLYLIDNQKEIIRNSEIAETLSMSRTAVSRAKSILVHELGAIDVDVMNERRTARNGYTYFTCLGSHVTVHAWLDE